MLFGGRGKDCCGFESPGRVVSKLQRWSSIFLLRIVPQVQSQCGLSFTSLQLVADRANVCVFLIRSLEITTRLYITGTTAELRSL